MKNYDSYFLSQLEFSEYERLNSVPERMALIEAECFDIPVDTIGSIPQSSTKEIIFALGMTVTLIGLSFFQLYSLVRSTPDNLEITKHKKVSVFNRKINTISEKKPNNLPGYQKIVRSTDKFQILMLKNEIANGKF